MLHATTRFGLRGGTAVWLLMLVGCGRSPIIRTTDAGSQADGTAVVHENADSQADGTAVVNENADSQADGIAVVLAPTCWGDERDMLPACARIDGCAPSPPPYSACVRTADCEFTFATPVGGYQEISVNCTYVLGLGFDASGDWSLSDDRRTVILTGSACDLAKASPSPRFLAISIHSCIP